jgi:twitching motility protein PilT
VERNFIEELAALANSSEPFTDIRLEQDSPVSVRLPEGWVEQDPCVIFPPTMEDLSQVMSAIEVGWEDTIKLGAINRPFELSAWRLRINAYLAYGGSKLMMSIRRIKIEPPTLKGVGLPPVVRLMLSAPRGLILISGATRSGKSTTAAAMIDEINGSRKAHIITIEDPIEYVFKKRMSVFSQREVGVDTVSFNDGLQDAMRQCPDVILVGEIRNRETAETALLAGESGHLVIGTLHANTATGAIQKMLSWFNDNERTSKLQSLSGSLIGVVNQILLPRADKQGYALATEIINNYDQDFSSILGEPAKINSAMERPESRKGSVLMAESLSDLATRDVVNKSDAMRAVTGLPGVQEKLKSLLKA